MSKMAVTDVGAKLGRLLDRLLETDFHVQDPEYLNLVIDNLKQKNNESLCRRYAVDWPRLAMRSWSKSTPSPTLLAFALNFASLNGAVEEIFVKSNAENMYEQLLDLSLKTPSASTSVRLALVRLVASFLSHKSGTQWILSTNYWSKVLSMTVRGETLYLQKEGCRFVASLLHKSIAINETFSAQVVQVVLAPLFDVARQAEIKEQAVYQGLCPTLNLLTQILEAQLETSISTDDYKVFLMLKERFQLDKLIAGILSRIRNDDFVFDLNKILFIYSFFELVHREGGPNGRKYIDIEKAIRTASGLFDVFLDSADRGTVSNLLKLCYFGHIYWRSIRIKMPACISQDKVELHFEDQLLMIQLYPAVMVSNKLLGNTLDLESEEDDFREDLVNELCRNVVHPTFRAVFKWRNYLLKNFSFDHAVLALKYVLHSKQFYTKDRANMAFRILVYSLKDITKTLMEQPEQVLVLSREANYICLLMETIAVLVREFDLTWKDSPETICVTEMTFNFLTFPVWPKKLVVKGLNLLELAISKGMSPSQALLIDTMKDSSLNLMAPMIYAKLHDPHWEIRDSALDVVRTISHNSREKFPSLRRIIIDGGFPNISLKMSTDDANPYVKAGALKCLQEMVGVDEYWDKLSDDPDVTREALRIVHEDPECIVRCEAATLVDRIYLSRDGVDEIVDLYDVMSDAAIVDLHWEVRARALDFWSSVIDRRLTNQGMIDGSFPSITFSKEHRKIVTLDRDAVRKRLVQVMGELEGCGCLGALGHALKPEEYELDVCKIARGHLEKLAGLLQQYSITPQDFTPTTPSPIVPMAFTPDNPPPRIDPAASTAAIDDIMASHDLNLLEMVLSSTGEKNLSEIRGRSRMHPGEFMRLLQKETTVDVDGLGSDGFESLLDDVLREYVVDLSMDCY